MLLFFWDESADTLPSFREVDWQYFCKPRGRFFFNLDFRGTMTVYGQIHPIKITLIYIVINQMIALLLKKVLLLKEGACYSRLDLSKNCRVI